MWTISGDVGAMSPPSLFLCRTSEIDGRCVYLRGSDRCEISYAATLTWSMCRSTFEDPIDVNFIIGASLSEPHTYHTAVQNPPYIRVYIRILVRPASNWSRDGPL